MKTIMIFFLALMFFSLSAEAKSYQGQLKMKQNRWYLVVNPSAKAPQKATFELTKTQKLRKSFSGLFVDVEGEAVECTSPYRCLSVVKVAPAIRDPFSPSEKSRIKGLVKR